MAEQLEVGGDSYHVREMIREDFADLSAWRQLEDHGKWHVERGRLVGQWLRESPSLFFTQKIEGDFIWQITAARVRPDEQFVQRFAANRHVQGADPFDKYNFNFWLRVDVPGELPVASCELPGVSKENSLATGNWQLATVPEPQSVNPFFQAYPQHLGTGWNGMGDDYWRSRFTTVVWNPDSSWVRLRRSPGYELALDCQNALPHLDYDEPRRFTFAVGRGRVRMYFDDRRVFDYEDAELPPAGYIGLCVWLCVMRFEKMRIYQWL